MTLPDWHASTDHIHYARSLLAQPKFIDLLSVLASIRPSLPLGDVSPTSAAILLGRREGMDQLLGVLLSLAHFPPPPLPDVAPDYGASEAAKQL